MAVEEWSENVSVVHAADDPAFSDELEQVEGQVATHPRHVVLDMAAVTFLNSSNISQLLRLRKALSPSHCRLILTGVRPEVWSAFLVAGLDKLFPTSESVLLALAGLQLSEAEAQG